MGNKVYKIKMDLYDATINVTFDKDVMSKLIGKEYDLNCSGLTYNKSDKYYVYIDTNKKDFDIVNTIAHESFHVVDFLFTNRGLHFVFDSDNEAWAYAIGYVSGKIYSFFGKENNKSLDKQN